MPIDASRRLDFTGTQLVHEIPPKAIDRGDLFIGQRGQVLRVRLIVPASTELRDNESVQSALFAFPFTRIAHFQSSVSKKLNPLRVSSFTSRFLASYHSFF